MASAPPMHVISLARTPQRLASFEAENAGVADWTVFAAVDGASVDAATRAALGDTALWTPGGVGAALSHIALWRLCVARDEALTIVEDDAVLRADFASASEALLANVPAFDFVLWGWNFDAVLEAELAPQVRAAVVADQPALRGRIEAFRRQQDRPALLRLSKALGVPCYTVSPKGAAALLAKCLPVTPGRLQLALMPHQIEATTFDLAMARHYASLAAYVCTPPLAVTRNDWAISGVRNPATPLTPPAALAQADVDQAQSRLADAVAVIQAAVVGAPADMALWTRLGLLLTAQGHLVAASVALGRALELDPASGAAAYNLARIRLMQGRPKEALALLDQALRRTPDFAPARSNRAVALLALGRQAEAEADFNTAAALDPSLAEARRGQAAVRRGRGDTVGAAEALEAARASAPRDVAVQEELAALHMALAVEANARGNLAEAERLTELAGRAPGHRLASLVARSDLMERLGRFDEALALAVEATRLDPRSPQALNNLGVAWLRLNRPKEAETAYRAALALVPDYPDAHHGLAFALLKQARFQDGWPEYEWRLRIPHALPWVQGFGQPLWTGEPRVDATLLLAAEQGLGDTLQAACLIAEIRARVGWVAVQAPAPLLGLLRRMPGVDEVVAETAPRPPHDLWLPMMSLPGLIGVTPDRVAPSPSLGVDPDRVASWRARLPAAGFRIGVAWQGNPDARVEHGRSFPLAALRPLAARQGVTLVSLQKGAGREQLAAGALPGVVDLGALYRDGDFEDTAAILAALDLVVCCDTAVAHLAGALGRPVWIALGENPDWRWPSGRDDSLWYATAKLFRRGSGEPWTEVFGRMAAEIRFGGS